jgi:TRAP-type C4-dicarboxylate transport system permease small subunit
MATRERRHITIDLLDSSISPRVKAVFNIIVGVVALVALAYLAKLGVWYLGIEREFGDTSPALKLPYWQMKSIMPVALALMSWRFFVLILEDAVALRTGEFKYLHGPDREGRLY